MANSDIKLVYLLKLKENLILRQIYYHNSSPNIDNEIHSFILKLDSITDLFH
jgi:hypothetical protein